MKNEITIKQWLEFAERSFNDVLNTKGLMEDCTGKIDLLGLLPSMTYFVENDVKLLVEPFYIVKGKDELKREHSEIVDFESKLSTYSHIYSITLARSITCDMFEIKYALLIRGVKKVV